MSSDRASMEIARFAPDEPLAERLVHLFVAMATELAATHERVDTLERMLADAGILEAGAVDAYAPDAAGQAARAEWREQFLDRIFEQLLGEIAAAGDSGDDRR